VTRLDSRADANGLRLPLWHGRVACLVAGAFCFFLTLTPTFAQNEMHHDHENIGWVPREILERPVPLRHGIGNLHEEVTTASPEAQKFYDQGLDYLHDYDWIEAIRSFNQALRLDPALAMAYIGLSDTYVALQDNEAAHAASEKAQSLAAKVSPRERTRIDIRAAQMNFLLDPRADMQKYFALRKMIGDALAANPADPWLWILRGFSDEGTSIGHGQGGGVDTIAFYETVLTLSPDNSAAHHYLAHSFENIGRTQQALEQTEALIRLAPDIPHAHHMRGHELQRLGRTDEAIQEFHKADDLENAYYGTENIASAYDWHHAHNMSLLALCYESIGQMKAAEPLLREAFALPAYTDVSEFNHREWPDFLLDRGRNEEALKAAQELVEKSSWPMGRFAGHSLAGGAFLAMNRMDDAKNELQSAERELEQVPATSLGALPNAGVLRAEILLREGKFADADASLKQIEEKIRAMPGPDSWTEALFQLQSIARAAELAGDWDLAEYTAKQMIEHDSSYAGGYYALGLVAEHGGDAASARNQFQLAEKLWGHADPDLPELVRIREKLGAAK
jgi:tetratricopeptide (TPR) repeat protein